PRSQKYGMDIRKEHAWCAFLVAASRAYCDQSCDHYLVFFTWTRCGNPEGKTGCALWYFPYVGKAA
ncbi:MAG: hypothetical protein WA124_13030, partial [Smithella sp.]